MRAILVSFARAVLSQLHLKMLLLTVMPFVFSVLIWGIALWIWLQPAIDWVRTIFVDNEWFSVASEVLGWFGLEALASVLVPLIAMWALLPLMVVTALIFVAMLAMPTIVKHVSQRNYPELERRHGGTFWGSVWISTYTFITFILLWILTLPLAAVPPLTFIIQPLLWGWLTYKIMTYDAIAEHASENERQLIMRRHRWPLMSIGAIAGTVGAAPTLLWLGGPFALVIFPFLAAFAIWLYVFIFVFTGLWFQHYCLEALALHRASTSHVVAQDALAGKDVRA